MNVAIIGCGRMGQKRAAALGKDDRLMWACDTGNACFGLEAGEYTHKWRYAMADPDVEAIIICTTPDVAPEIAEASVAAGKHVLLEKPGAHYADVLAHPLWVATANDLCIRVGFNLRYHRAMRLARELVDDGAIGDLLYVRGRYGHGGRLGYEKEWRCDPKISGGGVLIDLGVHLIDLAGWFLEPIRPQDNEGLAWGVTQPSFWMSPVEDNTFMCLFTPDGRIAHLHCSATEWKNTFQFEIFGRNGKIEINGLGGSYGVERCTLYRMLPEMGPPETTTWEYPMADDSFQVEWQEFKRDIAEKRTPVPGILEAQAALRIVEVIYEANR